jgi:nucleotide-binding universal stress UspA family protein
VEAEGYLSRMTEHFEGHSLNVTTEVGEGSPCEEIVRVLRRDRFGLVILLDHAPGRTSGLLLGATAGGVLLSAQTSVLLLPPAAAAPPLKHEPYREILIPLDGSERGEWVLDRAAILARAWGAQLHLVHILTPPDILKMHLRVSGEDRGEAIMRLSRQWAHRYLDETVSRIAKEGVRVDCSVVDGAGGIAPTLEDVADARGADLMILSARGAGCRDAWPYGSVATRMLLSSHRPVLVMQTAEAGNVD